MRRITNVSSAMVRGAARRLGIRSPGAGRGRSSGT
ncbi:hypothetical protein SAMN05421810_10191 [Amycolatopsis arida]|uniref:Uncharacterized protein n=1 Tax=Amycolatopsis arida TaxID=587909 RepID=A0A1I5KDS2_9PSEU|nr:hypothetical protein CLV69_10289 [Amycolatopsis arida]SFO82776.1 hypothetical protein SAMN05421810_10191 [Amycolatopsis arida]